MQKKIFMLSVLFLFAGIFLTIMLSINIIRPIKLLIKSLKKIEKGDLTGTVSGKMQKRRDEIGLMMMSLKSMSEKLKAVLTTVKETTDSFASASDQISATSQSLSSGANEQAANVEEVTSSLEEIGASIENNTQNSKSTDEIAQHTALQTEEGGRAVNQTVQSMRKISERISFIEDIAYQTNLLALNAAIEAARAGEHGKGFAVVAGEVRKLAENSQKASQEINELAVSSMEVAEKAGKLLEEIVPGIARTAELVQNITQSSEEQSIGVSQINSGMDQLNEISQHTASSSEELAATAENLAAQVGQLQEQLDYFTT